MAQPRQEQAIVSTRDISIALDSYEDLFSDFDPRPFSSREVSHDLMRELERRAMTDEKGKFELRFFLPKPERNDKMEDQVVKRLQAFFRHKAKQAQDKDALRERNGRYFVAAGLAALFVYAFLLGFVPSDSVLAFLEALLVPVGWFFMWEGLTKLLLDERAVLRRKVAFYERLSRANFIFLSEEENQLGAQQAKAGVDESAKK